MQVLGIFAREPVPGQVKTRLAASLGDDAAAEIHGAFLKDLIARFRAVADLRLLAYTPDEAGAVFEPLVGGEYRPVPQGPGDLGCRMERFFHSALAGASEHSIRGPARVVLIGSDSPTLPLALVQDAFTNLATCDVVLGPSTDGGYYLVGCRKSVPPIFSGVSWGGPHVLRETVARLQAAPLRLALLRPWYDVDTIDDWHMLAGHVAAMRRAGVDPALPRTERLLAKWNAPPPDEPQAR